MIQCRLLKIFALFSVLITWPLVLSFLPLLPEIDLHIISLPWISGVYGLVLTKISQDKSEKSELTLQGCTVYDFVCVEYWMISDTGQLVDTGQLEKNKLIFFFKIFKSFPPVLLRYAWDTTLSKFKMCSMETYTTYKKV